MSRLAFAVANIRFARGYTVDLLDTIPPADWFRVPPGGVSHVGWQVGHLAMAEYRLALERLRGPMPGDATLIPDSFLVLFGRDSAAEPDPAKYPAAEELRAVFDRVHERALAELADFPDADLDSPVLKPHRFCRTKLDCLNWCSHHEALHAGQIGLIRRQLGNQPLW